MRLPKFNKVDPDGFNSSYPVIDPMVRAVEGEDGDEKWHESFDDLVEYMTCDLEFPLWIDLVRSHIQLLDTFDWYNKNPFEYESNIKPEKEARIAHPDLVSHLSFEHRWFNILSNRSWRKIYEIALCGSGVWMLHVRYGFDRGVDDPRKIENFEEKWENACIHLNRKISGELSNSEISNLLENIKNNGTHINFDSTVPWNPEKTGDEPVSYETDWTYEEVFEYRDKTFNLRQ